MYDTFSHNQRLLRQMTLQSLPIFLCVGDVNKNASLSLQVKSLQYQKMRNKRSLFFSWGEF